MMKSLPSDKILKNAAIINTTLNGFRYNPENPQYLVVSYAIEIYEKQRLEQAWVETTIHIYDKFGKLMATIVDSHNIQSAFISSDGRYVLANEIFARIGDGVGEGYIGIVIYDVKNEKLESTLKGRLIDSDYSYMSVLDGKFGFYGTYRKNLNEKDLVTDNYIPVKFIIDPAQKVVYQKAYNFEDKPKVIPNVSIFFDVKGENLSTYQVFNF